MSGTESASPLLGTAGVGSGSRSRSPRAAGARKGQQETLGTSYLGSGLNGIAAALMVYELLVFLATVEEYDRPGLVVLVGNEAVDGHRAVHDHRSHGALLCLRVPAR